MIEKLLEPARFYMGDSAWIVLIASLAVTLAGTWVLYKFIRRYGESAGAIGTPDILLGFPLAVGAFVVPPVIYSVMYDAGPRSNPLPMGLITGMVALGAIALLAMHPWRRKTDPPATWARLNPKQLVWIPLIWLGAFPVLQASMLAGVAISDLTAAPVVQQGVIEQLRSDKSPMWIAGWYVSAVVAAPLMEEFVFRVILFGGGRGALGKLFSNGKSERPRGWRDPAGVIALVVSVSLFVLAHEVWNWPVGILPLTVLSVLLTLVYAHTRSIWPGVLLHGIHNAFVVTMQFFVLM